MKQQHKAWAILVDHECLERFEGIYDLPAIYPTRESARFFRDLQKWEHPKSRVVRVQVTVEVV